MKWIPGALERFLTAKGWRNPVDGRWYVVGSDDPRHVARRRWLDRQIDSKQPCGGKRRRLRRMDDED